MCTASHNPQAYTGAKLVERGRDRALRRRRHPGHPPPDRGRARRGARRRLGRGGRHLRGVPGRRARASSTRSPSSRCASSSTAATAWPARWSGRCSTQLGLDLVETYLVADGNFPDHEPNPLLEENRAVHRRPGARGEAPTSASPGTATPTAASSSTTRGASSTATSSPRCSPSRSCASSRARRSSTTCAPRRAVPDTVRARRRHRAGQPRRPRVLQDPHARRGRRSSAARSPATTTSTTSTTPTRARCRRCSILELLSVEGKTHGRAARALPREVLHLRRDQLRGRRPAGQDGRDRGALRRRPRQPPRRHLGRLRRLALQRAPVQHRAAAAPEPRVARLARGHGAPARRGARR